MNTELGEEIESGSHTVFRSHSTWVLTSVLIFCTIQTRYLTRELSYLHDWDTRTRDEFSPSWIANISQILGFLFACSIFFHLFTCVRLSFPSSSIVLHFVVGVSPLSRSITATITKAAELNARINAWVSALTRWLTRQCTCIQSASCIENDITCRL